MLTPFKHPTERAARFVVETIDGRAYVADGAIDAIERMRRDAWACAERSAIGYMRGVAGRVAAWNKYPVRADAGADTFLNDMQAAGLLTIREIN